VQETAISTAAIIINKCDEATKLTSVSQTEPLDQEFDAHKFSARNSELKKINLKFKFLLNLNFWKLVCNIHKVQI
jgi:hypothetical protein